MLVHLGQQGDWISIFVLSPMTYHFITISNFLISPQPQSPVVIMKTVFHNTPWSTPNIKFSFCFSRFRSLFPSLSLQCFGNINFHWSLITHWGWEMTPKISPLCQTFHTSIKKKNLWLLLSPPPRPSMAPFKVLLVPSCYATKCACTCHLKCNRQSLFF